MGNCFACLHRGDAEVNAAQSSERPEPEQLHELQEAERAFEEAEIVRVTHNHVHDEQGRTFFVGMTIQPNDH